MHLLPGRNGDRRWPAWLAVAVVELIAGVVVLALLAGRPEATSAPGALQQPSSAQVHAVSTLLAAHAKAVRVHDRPSYAATLDDAPASRDFRTRQLALYDNVKAVHFDEWDYATDLSPVTGPPVDAAAVRLHATVLIVRASFRYALAGVDAVPTAHDVWFTAVLRGSTWRLAGDTDVADAGGQSWRGPWDFGPVVETRSGPVTVLTHPRSAAQAATIAADVTAAVPVVTRVWGSQWARLAAVYVPDDQDEMSAVVGQGLQLDGFAAVAVADQVDTSTRSAVGQRIVVNPSALSGLDAASRRLVLAHELTHIATRPVTGPATPTWLVEGFADYVGHQAAQAVPGAPATTAAAAPALATLVRTGRSPTALPDQAEFGSGADRLGAAYDEAWLACRLIAHSAGQDGLVRLYRAVASAADPADALGPALLAATRLDAAAFTVRWQSYVRTQLAPR